MRWEVTKKVNFERMQENYVKETERTSEKDVIKLVDMVKENITRHNNIDTRTLIDNIQKKVTTSDAGYVTTLEVASDGSSYPTGPKEYAAALEKSYPNFIPALDKMGEIMTETLGRIKIDGG